MSQIKCEDCDGTGNNETCETCEGTGEVNEPKEPDYDDMANMVGWEGGIKYNEKISKIR